jgi:site-specific recombinase XerD
MQLHDYMTDQVSENDLNWLLAVRDLVCFYLLWHCGLRISEVCWLLVNDIDIESRKLFVRISKERKDRVVYISDTTAMVLHQYLTIRNDQDAIYVFTTRRGVMTPRTLQRRLVYYGKQCGVPVTAHRLRHTFASQMLGAGMPVTSLQRYLGHEHLDTTMIYAEVTNPSLQKDYYQGISAIDLRSEKMAKGDAGASHQEILRKLVRELKIPDLSPTQRDEILAQMQSLLEDSD